MGLEVTELFASTPPASGSPSARRVAGTEDADAGGTVVATAAAVEIGDWERGAGGAGGGAPASGSGFTATASVGSSGKAAMLARPTASPPPFAFPRFCDSPGTPAQRQLDRLQEEASPCFTIVPLYGNQRKGDVSLSKSLNKSSRVCG